MNAAALSSKRNFAATFFAKCGLLPMTTSAPIFPIFVIYVSMLLDNILRSVIVPLLPDLIESDEIDSGNDAKTEKHAILLASKTVIQLAANSFVAVFVQKMGYKSALLAGNFVLLATSLTFATGNTFQMLLLARGLHGIASTIIAVAGMSVCAESFTDDEKLRSKLIGFVIGSDAVGVLCSYSIGVFAFELFGKSIFFSVIAILISLNVSLLFARKNIIEANERRLEKSPTAADRTWYRLMGNPIILTISVALFLSSFTIAILEPCLPIWIRENIPTEKWQSGLIFLPDSVGYLIGTSVFSSLPFTVGKWKSVMLATLLVGACSILIPQSSTLLRLSIPHFCIGLGIGAVDSTVMPMLADFADFEQNTRYSSVYALEHGITSLAYVCGYLFTAELVKMVGFPFLIIAIGVVNIVYAAIIALFESSIVINANNSGKPARVDEETEFIFASRIGYKALDIYDESD